MSSEWMMMCQNDTCTRENNKAVKVEFNVREGSSMACFVVYDKGLVTHGPKQGVEKKESSMSCWS